MYYLRRYGLGPILATRHTQVRMECGKTAGDGIPRLRTLEGALLVTGAADDTHGIYLGPNGKSSGLVVPRVHR